MMIKNKYCTKCGAELNENDCYCPSCGTAVYGQPSQESEFDFDTQRSSSSNLATQEVIKKKVKQFKIMMIVGWSAFAVFLIVGIVFFSIFATQVSSIIVTYSVTTYEELLDIIRNHFPYLIGYASAFWVCSGLSFISFILAIVGTVFFVTNQKKL